MLHLDCLLILSSAFLLRCLLMAHPHSGQKSPPMFGDYEAQRHWQEITLNLPIEQWYTNSSQNDLGYWGLDYPPLTAYHSLAVAKVAQKIDSTWVQLTESRGMEEPSHKFFMRISVLFVDLLVFFPSVLLAVRAVFPDTELRKNSGAILSLATMALYPGLILIDNGHFQYNNASLGLFLIAVSFLLMDFDLLGSVFFTLALNYKQMELYHALPFFFFLLGRSLWHQKTRFGTLAKLMAIGLTVIGTFALVWLPFLGSLDIASAVLKRLFPVGRGLFEDKVSNFWCSLNIVFKIKDVLPSERLFMVSAGVTLALSLVPNLDLFIRPSAEKFVQTLCNTSLAFFLFSYQVHEKSILLAAIPVTLHLAMSIASLPSTRTNSFPGSSADHLRHWVERHSIRADVWFLVISVFSMLPLLIKDGLAIPTVSLTIFYLFSLIQAGVFETSFVSLASSSSSKASSSRTRRPTPNARPVPICEPTLTDRLLSTLFWLSLSGCVALFGLSMSASPPKNLPDLWPVLVSLYSAGHFVLYFGFSIVRQLLAPNNHKSVAIGKKRN